MHSTQQHPASRQEQGHSQGHTPGRRADPRGRTQADPRAGGPWSAHGWPGSEAGGGRQTPAGGPARASMPVLQHRRDGILPAVAAALSVRGETLTCTGSKGEAPSLHPLVQGFLDGLGADARERHTGRCPEAVLLSRFLTAAEAARTGKRAGRKPLSHSEAKRSLKQAKLTTRRIREDGDPQHGSYAPPCRSCAPLLAHFGVRAVAPGPEEVR